MITEEYLIHVFDEREIPLNKRVLTDWRAKNYLPPLETKGRGQGKGRSYFWTDQKVIERALLIDEALNSNYRGSKVLMVLWLFGHEISPASIRNHLITSLAKVGRLMRGDSTDSEAIDEHIYAFTEKYYQLASRYPQLNLPHDNPASVMEMALNIFANPGYDLADTPFDDGIRASIEIDKQICASATKPKLSEIEAIQNAKQMWRFVHEQFSLSHAHRVITTTTDQTLRQVQNDVSTLFAFLGQQWSERADIEALREFSIQFAYFFGMLLTVTDLTLRERGLGHFIDTGLARLTTQSIDQTL